MRIMHVLLSRGFAGSERSTAEACNEQARLGHNVALALRRSHRQRHGSSILDHLEDSVQRYVLPDRLGTQQQLARAIAHWAPELIHTHLRRGTRLVARLRPRAATVATLHLSINGPQFLELDGLICNAEWQRRSVPPSYRGQVFKMNNSLVPHRRLAPEERLALRAQLGISAEEFVIGAVGRLAHSKGFDILIRAFTQARLPESRLVILGEGRERRRLRRLAPEHSVLLPGFRPEVKDYYQVFDLFVCPSRREPLPRVILEALDAGTPVIASQADGCRELVEQYGGELFPIEDVDALAALLRAAQREPRPHRVVDLSAHLIGNVTLTYLAAYERLIRLRSESSAAA